METIHLVRANQGEHLLVGTDIVTIKASGQETSGRMLIIEVRVSPGGGPLPLHRHHYVEIFYILEGEFEISTTDADTPLRTVKMEAGDTLAIPSMVWHNFKNVGTTPGRFLAVHSPAGMEAFAREIGTPVEDPLNPPQPTEPPTEEQRKQMMATILKYMEVLPPDTSSE